MSSYVHHIHLGFLLPLEEMAITVAMNDARNTLEDKIDIIEAEYYQSLEALEIGLRLLNKPMPQGDVSELRDLIENGTLAFT